MISSPGSIVATSTTTEAERQAFAMAMASAEILYARKLSDDSELGFAQLLPNQSYEHNKGCISPANHMHLHNRSKHVALRFCLMSHGALIEIGQFSSPPARSPYPASLPPSPKFPHLSLPPNDWLVTPPTLQHRSARPTLPYLFLLVVALRLLQNTFMCLIIGTAFFPEL